MQIRHRIQQIPYFLGTKQTTESVVRWSIRPVNDGSNPEPYTTSDCKYQRLHQFLMIKSNLFSTFWWLPSGKLNTSMANDPFSSLIYVLKNDGPNSFPFFPKKSTSSRCITTRFHHLSSPCLPFGFAISGCWQPQKKAWTKAAADDHGPRHLAAGCRSLDHRRHLRGQGGWESSVLMVISEGFHREFIQVSKGICGFSYGIYGDFMGFSYFFKGNWYIFKGIS